MKLVFNSRLATSTSVTVSLMLFLGSLSQHEKNICISTVCHKISNEKALSCT